MHTNTGPPAFAGLVMKGTSNFAAATGRQSTDHMTLGADR